MGETTTRSWGKETKTKKVVGTSDKDLAQGLLILPRIARTAIFQAARELGSEGLLLLLTKYYLTPKQISNLRFEQGSLRIDGFGDVVEIANRDVDTVLTWLQKKGRPATQRSIRNHISRSIQKRARAILAEQESLFGPCPWRCYLTVGIRDLKRWAQEELADTCEYDEGVVSR